MPIQGTAADILKLAMIDISQKISEKNLSGKMILQVHDELVFDVPESEKKIFEQLIRDSMERIFSLNDASVGMRCMLLSRENTITQGDSHEKCNTSKWRRDRPNVLSAQKRRTD